MLHTSAQNFYTKSGIGISNITISGFETGKPQISIPCYPSERCETDDYIDYIFIKNKKGDYVYEELLDVADTSLYIKLNLSEDKSQVVSVLIRGEGDVTGCCGLYDGLYIYTQNKNYCTPSGPKVNVRSDQSVKASVNFQLDKGEFFEILEVGKKDKVNGKDGAWYKIDYNGKSGYIFSFYTICP